jgi:hypothetical protein
MAKPRTYSISGENLTVAGATTLAFVNPPAAPGPSLDILRVEVSQNATTTLAAVRLRLFTQVTAFPTLTSATPAAHNRGNGVSVVVGGTAGAAGTAGVNASAEGAGTKTTLIPVNPNNLNGWLWVPTEEERIVLPAGLASGFGVGFIAAPATLTGWTVTLTYAES